nr:neutral zinc metallopeptidase [Thioalbus denitrificans]
MLPRPEGALPGARRFRPGLRHRPRGGAPRADPARHLRTGARGTVNPDSFTHGSSAQRVRWFRIGLESGALERCDTFAVETP